MANKDNFYFSFSHPTAGLLGVGVVFSGRRANKRKGEKRSLQSWYVEAGRELPWPAQPPGRSAGEGQAMTLLWAVHAGAHGCSKLN